MKKIITPNTSVKELKEKGFNGYLQEEYDGMLSSYEIEFDEDGNLLSHIITWIVDLDEPYGIGTSNEYRVSKVECDEDGEIYFLTSEVDSLRDGIWVKNIPCRKRIKASRSMWI